MRFFIIFMVLISLLKITFCDNVERIAKNLIFYYDTDNNGNLSVDELKVLIEKFELSDIIAQKLYSQRTVKLQKRNLQNFQDTKSKSILNIITNGKISTSTVQTNSKENMLKSILRRIL